ncbi:exoribonuclease 1 [Rhinolophus ferrumequinum]|uniref:Exoribonuclease 1 n=1 Tax=Rhinolophus ferrumequinum TaxID=59479 RepID=A0A7J7ZPD8_RHIFE|nr:exoribonuclease 1 [Rhinolophus ferrumequinum]
MEDEQSKQAGGEAVAPALQESPRLESTEERQHPHPEEDTFQQYVRPEINTQLSDFCISLTGITQDQVDGADTFPQVLKKVIDWMKVKELGTKYKYCILTDGSWDMSKFLNIQCRLNRLKYPPFAKKWINIRKSYGNFYKFLTYLLGTTQYSSSSRNKEIVILVQCWCDNFSGRRTYVCQKT